ncbi:MAG TPA: chlorite dismutase family protein [Actinomycetes bacterium]|nr:chlorite dismutase family protein [Actinomycetes bacterium]
MAATGSGGWAVTHLYYRLHAGAGADADQAGKELVAALDAFAGAPDHQVLTCTVLGLKADLGVMALGPELARHDALPHALAAGAAGAVLEPAFSYVSVTELSEYLPTVEETRARTLAEHGPDGLDERMAEAEARLARYREDKLHPRLPRRGLLAFYPMSKAREPGANWYRLPFEERRQLMSGHAAVGRRYAGRVLQLITGSTGLDEFEWGVTLLADDLAVIKEIVYDMRFDEVTASYGRFGPFLVGLTVEPAELPGRLGLRG